MNDLSLTSLGIGISVTHHGENLLSCKTSVKQEDARTRKNGVCRTKKTLRHPEKRLTQNLRRDFKG
jgi:hypothetical protein